MNRSRVLLFGMIGALLLAFALSFGTASAASATGQDDVGYSRIAPFCFRGTSPRCPNRIVFRRGATSARVWGRLFGIRDKRFFVLWARAGQHMQVTITGAGPTRGIVFFPAGGSSGQPGGIVFDEDLTQTGNYIIEVEESMMANAWVGDFRLDVSIH
jgi:hypothetical protein